MESARRTLDTALDSVTSLASRVLGPAKPPPPPPRVTRHVRFFTLDVSLGARVSLRIVGNGGGARESGSGARESGSGARGRGREVFAAVLGEAVPEHAEFTLRRFEEELVVKFIGYATLTITHVKQAQSTRYDVEWRLAIDGEGFLQDSISLGHNHWLSSSAHSLPAHHPPAPYVSWDAAYAPGGGYGSCLERYWLAASGVGVLVDSEVPLFVSMSEHTPAITFTAKFEKPYRNVFEYKLFLKYSIIEGSDMRAAHDALRQEFFPKPDAAPASQLFRKILWSTGHLGAAASDTALREFLEQLSSHGFEPGIIEFADDWTPAYGDMEFDASRFKDCKKMLQGMKHQGFEVIVWVHPFASPRSAAFYEGTNLWVKSSMIEGVTGWAHGPAKLLDVTNPDARTCFKKKLKYLQEEYGIDGFMFDAGQVNYLPSLAHTFEPLSNPNHFTRNYVNVARDVANEGHVSLVRSGAGTQSSAAMVRLEERSASWGWDNGLKTVIPGVLGLGMAGYLYVTPGQVGGRAVSEGERELYVRWLETVLFMPALTFSLPPWKLGIETLSHVTELLALRQRHVDYLQAVAADSQESGQPMVRPLWWRAPEDTVTHTIDSQYMLGHRLLLAPVMEKGMTTRTLYLPAGTWEDGLRGGQVTGKRWLYSYRARLGELPHFMLLPGDAT